MSTHTSQISPRAICRLSTRSFMLYFRRSGTSVRKFELIPWKLASAKIVMPRPPIAPSPRCGSAGRARTMAAPTHPTPSATVRMNRNREIVMTASQIVDENVPGADALGVPNGALGRDRRESGLRRGENHEGWNREDAERKHGQAGGQPERREFREHQPETQNPGRHENVVRETRVH